MIVPRLLPIIAAFALGAAVSWWIAQPAAIVVATDGFVETPQSSPADRVLAVELDDGIDENSIGIPPTSATVPKSHPSAGQKRALARALDDLERNPPTNVDPPRDFDPVAAAAFADTLAAALAEGDSR